MKMRVVQYVFSTLLSLWKRKLVKCGLLLFVIFEIVIIFKYDLKLTTLVFNRNETSLNTQQNSTDLNTMTLNKRTSSVKTSGHFNLHLWSDTCATDLNILCNFPMFPKAPDNRRQLNETIIADNITNHADGLRLFGFIIPDKSGLYRFTVKFCRFGEVWLSNNENWKNAGKIWDSGNKENMDFQSSNEISLVAGKKYFIEFVATGFIKRNKIQLLWKTPMSSAFEIINGTFLSHYMKDSGLTDSNIYDELLPDSVVCASRRNNNTYFPVQREISYLLHDEVKNTLPYCEYNPSYTVNHRVERWYAVNRLVVHSFIYPFPEHISVQDQKNWIFPLGEHEALEVVDIFMESLNRKMPG